MIQNFSSTIDYIKRKTKAILVYQSFLSEPLNLMFNSFGAVIVYKALKASSFQVTIFTMLKPTMALLAFYWGALIHQRRDKLISNVVWAGILSRIPFLFFPLINNPWAMIFCCGLYMFFNRAGNPAWVEILKINLPKKERGQAFSFASALGYAEGVLLAIWIGPIMTRHEEIWKWIFPISAILGITSVFMQMQVPMTYKPVKSREKEELTFIRKIINPWINCFRLLKKREDFAHFQTGFMLCGFGVMLVIPALPILFVDTLGLSYKELAIALVVCKGFGYVISSRVWAYQLNKVSIFSFMRWVHVCFALYAMCLIFAKLNNVFVYLGFIVYGIAQGGSHLSWNLSGPIFSQEEDSSSYSTVNVLMVGLRGCVAPALGGFLCAFFGPQFVLVICTLLSLYAAYKAFEWDVRKKISFL